MDEIEILHGGQRLDIAVRYWQGPREYCFVSADGMGSIGLGVCGSVAAIGRAVAEAIAQGTEDTDWSGWRVVPGEM